MARPLGVRSGSLRAAIGGWLAGAVVLAGCGDSRTPPEVAVSEASRALFFHHVVDPTPPGGAECCTDVIGVGDLNGDGYADIVVGGEHASGAGLVWYEYPTWARHAIAAGDFTTDMEVADFDGDGDLDVVAGDMSTGIVWVERAGDGSWKKNKLADGYAHDLAVADLDGDGQLDLVVADKKGAYLLYGRGGGVTREEVSSEPGEGLDVADLDGDGNLDIVYANRWFSRHASGSGWLAHEIDGGFPADTRARAADIDGDGRLDVVLSPSEGTSRLAWFEQPREGGSGAWTRHDIGEDTLTGAHSLAVADIDLNGTPDVVVAEMSTSPARRIIAYLNEGNGATWRRVLLATHGSHNMLAHDVDGDGDTDLLGKNYSGPGRFVEYWENRSADLRLVPSALMAGGPQSGWIYAPIDTARPDADARKLGLLAADLNGDGATDVVAGSTIYVNPAHGQDGPWRRVQTDAASDVIHATRHVQNGWRALVAVSPRALRLLTAETEEGLAWVARDLHRLPEGRTQGYVATAPEQGRYDLFFTRGTRLYRLHVTDEPPSSWMLSEVWEGVQEEGVAAADLDGDGDTDLIAVDGDGKRLLWLEGAGEDRWAAHRIGASLRWLDRVAVADLNGDGRLDVVFTEETRDSEYNARVAWLEAPEDPVSGRWSPRTIAVLRSANSLDVLDFDEDGDSDVVIAEHTDLRPGELASDNFVGVFLNRGDGTFELEVIEIGPYSSHLGALAARLTSGAHYDVVSVGWEQTCCVHRWTRRPGLAIRDSLGSARSREEQ
ncbi:MAG TPA: VCBS repeat-containing protein [Longimicrobiales bacterium]